MYEQIGKGVGAAGGSALLGALGRVSDVLDKPRRALWNVPGKLAEGDWLGALPGLAGLAAGGLTAATGVGLPFAATVGSLVGGLGQGIGESLDEDRFRAPSPEDVTGSDNPLLNMLVGAAGDPLTYAGGLGGKGLGGMLGRGAEAKAAEGGGSLLKALAADEEGAVHLPDWMRDTTHDVPVPGPGMGEEGQRIVHPSGNVTAEWHGGKATRPPDVGPGRVPAVPRGEPWEENPWAVLGGGQEPRIERFAGEEEARSFAEPYMMGGPGRAPQIILAPGQLPAEFERDVIAPKYGMLGDLALEGLPPAEARPIKYGLWEDILNAEQGFEDRGRAARLAESSAGPQARAFLARNEADYPQIMRHLPAMRESPDFLSDWRQAGRRFSPEQTEELIRRWNELQMELLSSPFRGLSREGEDALRDQIVRQLHQSPGPTYDAGRKLGVSELHGRATQQFYNELPWESPQVMTLRDLENRLYNETGHSALYRALYSGGNPETELPPIDRVLAGLQSQGIPVTDLDKLRKHLGWAHAERARTLQELAEDQARLNADRVLFGGRPEE